MATIKQTIEAEGFAVARGSRRQIAVRMRPELFDIIKKIALSHRRSISEEIVGMLESFYVQPSKPVTAKQSYVSSDPNSRPPG